MRHKRYAELFPTQKAALLEALRICRTAVIEAYRNLKPSSRTYRLGEPLVTAIDDMAEELTGDAKHFHEKPNSTS
jgi:hypothetical protein